MQPIGRQPSARFQVSSDLLRATERPLTIGIRALPQGNQFHERTVAIAGDLAAVSRFETGSLTRFAHQIRSEAVQTAWNQGARPRAPQAYSTVRRGA